VAKKHFNISVGTMYIAFGFTACALRGTVAHNAHFAVGCGNIAIHFGELDSYVFNFAVRRSLGRQVFQKNADQHRGRRDRRRNADYGGNFRIGL
jgi:hypothetical protein